MFQQQDASAALTALNMAAFANHQKKLMSMEENMEDKESADESPDEDEKEVESEMNIRSQKVGQNVELKNTVRWMTGWSWTHHDFINFMFNYSYSY